MSFPNAPKTDMKTVLPNADEVILSLIRGMIAWNPEERFSI